MADVVPGHGSPAQLWSKTDRAVWGLSLALGMALWAWGWWVASGTAVVGETVIGVVLGVVAIGVAGSGALSWIAAGRRAVRDRHREVASFIDRHLAPLTDESTTRDADALVAVAGSPRVHRPDCLLVRGKTVTTLPSSGKLPPRSTPCEMCTP